MAAISSSKKGSVKEIMKASLFLRRRHWIPGALIVALGLCLAIFAANLFLNRKPHHYDDAGGITLSNVKIVNDHNGFVWFFCFSPDGKFLSCSNTNWVDHTQVPSCDVWQVSTATKVASIENFGYEPQAFSPDGKTLAAMGHDGIIRFWDTATWKENKPANHLELSDHIPVHWLDNNTLGLWHTKGVALWDLTTHKLIREFPSHPKAVAFSPNGKFLVTVDSDPEKINLCEVNLWEIGSGNKVWSFPAHRRSRQASDGHTEFYGGAECLAFAPDSQTFATGGTSRSVLVWDAAARRQVAEYSIERPFGIISVAFSPDGKLLAAADGAATDLPSPVYLWDLTTGKRLGVWKTREWGIRQIAFSPDGKLLAVATTWSTGYVELWSVEEMLGAKANK
jgi:WD40 repeat protein